MEFHPEVLNHGVVLDVDFTEHEKQAFQSASDYAAPHRTIAQSLVSNSIFRSVNDLAHSLPQNPSLFSCSLLSLRRRWRSSQAGPRPCRYSRNSSSLSESSNWPSDSNSSPPLNPVTSRNFFKLSSRVGSRRVATTTCVMSWTKNPGSPFFSSTRF